VLQAVASPTTSGVAAGGGPESLVGLITFDGVGNFQMRLHKNANGTFVQADVTGTYTVQANCDGATSPATVPFPFGAMIPEAASSLALS